MSQHQGKISAEMATSTGHSNSDVQANNYSFSERQNPMAEKSEFINPTAAPVYKGLKYNLENIKYAHDAASQTNYTFSPQYSVQKHMNKTGMPDFMKARVEALSGINLNDVKVFYNSPKPAHINALAYTSGNEIYLGPGQEKHLQHEAWHVVQQKQKRVKPTVEMENNVQINDEPSLEKEADVMSLKIMKMRRVPSNPSLRKITGVNRVLQCKIIGNPKFTKNNKKTIRGVLRDKNLDKVYSLPNLNLRKGTTSLDRTTEAQATITTHKKNKRGKKSGDYTDVGALGNWERLAASHDLAKKTIDIGHLIADEFFDKPQKSEAYVAANLAPQNAVFNEKAYRRLVEEPVGKDLKKADVNLTVKLDYKPDNLVFLVEQLVQRKALKVLDMQKHNKNVQKGLQLSIPRRLPTDWEAIVTRVSDVKSNKKINKKKTKTKTKTSPLQVINSATIAKFPITNPSRKFFTQKVPFTHKQVKNTVKQREFAFKQKHAFEDPLATLNPAKIGANPESGRYTEKQQKRAKTTIKHANVTKLINKLREININKTIKKKKLQYNLSDDQVGKIFALLTGSNNQNWKDVKKSVRTLVLNSITDNDLKKLLHTSIDKSVNDALSEDEDENDVFS